jgi:RNA polymerase sigma factor (sigma-70 family)
MLPARCDSFGPGLDIRMPTRYVSVVVRDPSDELLVAAMAAGDAGAATAFVRRHQQRVFGVALAVVRDRELARDVAQETFVRAWRSSAVYDPRRAAVTTWLLVIARNAAIDASRVRRPEPRDPGSLLALAGAAAGAAPDDRAAAGDDVARLRRALATVPPDQRRAVVLAGIGGFTGAEIAEREGIPLGTAKTRIRSGLRRLRDALQEEVPGGLA